MTLAELLTAMFSVVSQIFSNIGTVFDTALDNVLVQLVLGVWIGGAVIGYARRILNIV